jgi:hypothetical protein
MLRRYAFIFVALFVFGAAGLGLATPNAFASTPQIHVQLSVNTGPNGVRNHF